MVICFYKIHLKYYEIYFEVTTVDEFKKNERIFFFVIYITKIHYAKNFQHNNGINKKNIS